MQLSNWLSIGFLAYAIHSHCIVSLLLNTCNTAVCRHVPWGRAALWKSSCYY